MSRLHVGHSVADALLEALGLPVGRTVSFDLHMDSGVSLLTSTVYLPADMEPGLIKALQQFDVTPKAPLAESQAQA